MPQIEELIAVGRIARGFFGVSAVDADHLTVHIDQRPTTIARVNGSIRLARRFRAGFRPAMGQRRLFT